MQLKHTDRRIIEQALDMASGYVLNFSDRTFAEFFTDHGVKIYQEKYGINGTSKAKHMRAFWEVEPAGRVCRILRELLSYRDSLPGYNEKPADAMLRTRFLEVIERIEKEDGPASTDAIERFSQDETLDELVSALERDIGANRPVAALDRLHTYCLKKFAHLLDEYGVEWQRAEPLHSRVGKYAKALSGRRELRDVSTQIIKNAFGVFEKFNHVRNNQSLAHDNKLVDRAEARFIYDSVTAFLRFVKTVEADRFGN